MSFLPADYEAPKTNNGYMKILPGENRIRILSSPIIGWEDWKDNRPIRFKMNEKPEASIDKDKPIRHFWAMIVWNYKDEQVQILQITQAGIRNAIEALCKDKDWGAPYSYDIKIVKTGQDQKTKYVANPMPHKPLSQAIKDAFNKRSIRLEALFDNEDPFDGKGRPTLLANENVPQGTKTDVISEMDAMELDEILYACDPEYVKDILTTWQKMGIKNARQLPVNLHERVKTAALKNREIYKAKKMKEIESEALPF